MSGQTDSYGEKEKKKFFAFAEKIMSLELFHDFAGKPFAEWRDCQQSFFGMFRLKRFDVFERFAVRLVFS